MTLTREQREIRARGIGSSDIAAVCGLNPYRKPIDVYLEKTGRAESQPENEQSELGHTLEAIIADRYAKQAGVTLTRSTTHVGREPWMIATPDYDEGTDAHVECKNVGYRMVSHWTDGAPEYVTIQGQWQMEVTLRMRVTVAALLGGRDFVTEPTLRDLEIGAALAEIGETFWKKNVLADVAPAVDESESWGRYLVSRFPSALKPALAAPPDADEIAQRWLKADDELKRAQIRRDEAAHELQLLIGDAKGMYAKSWRASWSDVAAAEMKAHTRKAYRQFRLTSTGR